MPRILWNGMQALPLNCNNHFELQSRIAQNVSSTSGQKVPLHNLPVHGNTKLDLNEFPDHRLTSIVYKTL